MNKVWLMSLAFGIVLGGQNLAWSQYKAIEVSNGGVINGHVTVDGDVPTPLVLPVPHSQDICGKVPLYDESLIASAEGGGLKNAVVWLTDISEGKAWPSDSDVPALNQIGCRFDPHVIVVPEIVRFDILNRDGTLHNIHTHGEKNRPINRAHPKLTPKISIRFRLPEFVKLTCDVHDWMEGWIVVAAHPYFAVTDDNGAFEIGHIPAGTYKVEFWHEILGTQQKEITVTADGEVQLNALFEMR